MLSRFHYDRRFDGPTDVFDGRRTVRRPDTPRLAAIAGLLEHVALRAPGPVWGNDRLLPWIEGAPLELAGLGERTRSVAIEVLRALAHLHAAGFAHADVKPDNLLVRDAPGRVTDVVLIDLAFATPFGAPLEGGSLSYLAPELAASPHASAAIDLFAFGRTFEQAEDEAVRQLAARCIAPDPALRPSSAARALDALGAALRPRDRERPPRIAWPARAPGVTSLRGAIDDGVEELVRQGALLLRPAASPRAMACFADVFGVAPGPLPQRFAAALALAPHEVVLDLRAADEDARTSAELGLRLHALEGRTSVVLVGHERFADGLGVPAHTVPAPTDEELASMADAAGVALGDEERVHLRGRARAGADDFLERRFRGRSEAPRAPLVARTETAEEAWARGAPRRALALLDEGAPGPGTAELRARALAQLGDLEAALEVLSAQLRDDLAPELRREAAGWAIALGRHERVATWLDGDHAPAADLLRARAARERSDPDRCAALAASVRDRGQPEERARATLLLVDVAIAAGERARAGRLLDELDVLPTDALRAEHASRRASLHASEADWDAAAALYAEAFEHARRAGDPRSLPVHVLNLAVADHARGRWSAAIAGYERACNLADALGRPLTAVAASTNLAALLATLEADEDAWAALRRSRAGAEATGYASYALLADLVEAELVGRRDPEKGRARAVEVAAAFDDAGLARHALEAQLLAAELGADTPLDAAAIEASGHGPRLRLLDARRALDAGQVPLAVELAGKVAEECATSAPLRSLAALELVADAHERAGTGAADDHRARARLLRADLALRLPAELARAFAARGPAEPKSRGASGTREASEDVDRLFALARRILLERDEAEVLAAALDEAVASTGAERAFLLRREGRSKTRVVVARNLDREHVRRPRFRFSRSIAESVLTSGEPVVTASAMEEMPARSVQAMKLRSVLCVPIRTSERVLAALYLDHRFLAGAFGEEARQRVARLADLVGLALENARLHAALERSAQAAARDAERARAEAAARADEVARLTRALGGEGAPIEDFVVGTSRPMRHAVALLARAAGTELPVLVEGESGTGKEALARYVHERSARSDGPLVRVNCAALSATLLESELFGHVAGAFTGADRAHEGLFRAASGGTIFLDEIGEMPLAMQSRLLRVLQEGTVRPVGSTREVPTDARIVAATNRDLRRAVEEGAFRQDLYFRLAAVHVEVPPLRERRADLPALAEALLERIAQEPGMRRVRLASSAQSALAAHDWPGNVRELEQTLRRAILTSDGPELSDRHLVLPSAARGRREALAAFDRDLLARALADAGGNKTAAARALGISRPTLYRWLDRHGLR